MTHHPIHPFSQGKVAFLAETDFFPLKRKFYFKSKIDSIIAITETRIVFETEFKQANRTTIV